MLRRIQYQKTLIWTQVQWENKMNSILQWSTGGTMGLKQKRYDSHKRTGMSNWQDHFTVQYSQEDQTLFLRGVYFCVWFSFVFCILWYTIMMSLQKTWRCSVHCWDDVTWTYINLHHNVYMYYLMSYINCIHDVSLNPRWCIHDHAFAIGAHASIHTRSKHECISN